MASRPPRVSPEDLAEMRARARVARHGDIWLRAWLAVAGSWNAKTSDCTRYADRCLAEYIERFDKEQTS